MRPWYRFCRFLCQAAFTGLLRGRVFGVANVPPSGGVLLLCNHQSMLDPVLATLALPRECHYMARDTLFAKPIFRWLIESLNAFPIRRGAADISAIKETLRRLKAGALITAFPEGTRTPDGSILAMQPGSILIARKARVVIVPTLILGAFEAWPRGAPFPLPRPVIVAYDAPIEPAWLDTVDDDAAIRHVRARIMALRDQYSQHPLLRSRLNPLRGEPASAAPAQTPAAAQGATP